MEQILATTAVWISAALFLWALLGSVCHGIRQLNAAPVPLGTARMDARDVRRIFYWLLGTTVGIYAVGILAQWLQYGMQSLPQAFANAFHKADALHYLEIAQNGYTAVGETRYFIVFFPLFPLLVRLFSLLTFGDLLLSAVLLNFVLMFFACLYIFQLGILEFEKRTVHAAIQLMLLFPVAFFFHNAYSEPLFLLTSAASLYYTRTRRWIAAGCMGFLCAFTRAAGVLCAVPLVAQAFIDAWQNGRLHVGAWLRHAVWSLLAPLGTGGYLLLNYAVTGNAFMFLIHQREHWYNGFSLFPNAVRTVTDRMLTNEYAHHAALWISQFVAIFLFLFLLIAGIRRLCTALSLYNCAYFLMMISAAWLLSGPRYLMAMFPAFYVLADVCKTPVRRGTALALSGLALVVMTACFSIGHSIY